MLIGKTIQQTAMAHAAIAMAVARILVQNLSDAPGQQIRVKNNFISELRGLERRWQCSLRQLGVEGRNSIIRAATLHRGHLRARIGKLRKRDPHSRESYEQETPANFRKSFHECPQSNMV